MAHMLDTMPFFFFSICHVTEYNHALIEVTLRNIHTQTQSDF